MSDGMGQIVTILKQGTILAACNTSCIPETGLQSVVQQVKVLLQEVRYGEK